ncbi:hypothetical protein PAXRUDRAFT_806130, partial [Paxillus rubicundulus Ve08.2h10]
VITLYHSILQLHKPCFNVSHTHNCGSIPQHQWESPTLWPDVCINHDHTSGFMTVEPCFHRVKILFNGIKIWGRWGKIYK